MNDGRLLEKKNNGYAKALLVAFILMMFPQVFHNLSDYKTIMYALLYVLSIIVIIFYLRRYKLAFSRNRVYLLFAYIIVLLMPFLCNVISGNTIAVYDYFDVLIRLTSFIFFFLLIPKGIKAAELKTLFVGIVVVMVIACLYNVFVNFTDLLNISKIANSYSVNFMSFFSNRNTFAMYLFAGIFSALVLLKMNIGNRKILIAIMIFEIINLLFTMSRGGILATFIVLLPSLFDYFRSHRASFIIFLILLLVVSGFVMNNKEIQDIITRLFIRPDAGTSGRSDLWQEGMELVRGKRLLTGVGYYTAMSYTGISQFHSMFVDTLVDTGLFGLLFKLAIIFYVYLRIISKKYFRDLKVVFKWGIYAIVFLGVFESVNIFALGSTEMLYTILFVNVPLLISESGADNKKVEVIS